jgi:rubredoxin
MSAAGGRSVTTCPECGRPHAFFASRGQGSRPYRNRVCRFCGHVHQEVAPKPVIVQETSFSRD